ncbi:MAG: Kelch repeat-containing protein [Candidatus Bathyarchaeales archaeon]
MSRRLFQLLIGVVIASLLLATVPLPSAGAAENEWAVKAPMQIARGGVGVAAVDGKIYAIGGISNNTQLSINEEYNPATNTWTTKTPMPTARSGFAIAVYKNKIYCIGGTVGDSNNVVSGFTGANEVYDPTTDKWETKTPMPTPRADLEACVVDGKIYLIGGKAYWGTEPFYHELNVTEVYDPETDTWTTASSMPIPVFGYAAAVVDDKIYIMGGARQFQEGLANVTIVSSTQVYDTKSNTWGSRTELPIALSYAAACVTSGVTAPRRIYLIGGFDRTNYSNATFAYDFEQDAWSAGALMPTARAYLGLAVVGDVIYAIGGFNGLNMLAANERYAPIGYGTVPPQLQILSPENKTYASKNVPLVLSVNRPTNWLCYSLDDQQNVTITGDTILSDLAEGAHKLVVSVNDTFGNIVSSEAVYFSVDTVPPKITVLIPKNMSYGETDINAIYIVDEPVSWIGYSLDGRDNVTVTGNVTLAVLSEGSHSFTVYATDLVGNTGTSETIYFVVAPFPTVLVVASAAIVTIIVVAGYLLLLKPKLGKSKTNNNQQLTL